MTLAKDLSLSFWGFSSFASLLLFIPSVSSILIRLPLDSVALTEALNFSFAYSLSFMIRSFSSSTKRAM